MTITRYEAIQLSAALKSLDGRVCVEKDADGKVVVVSKPYALKGSVRYAIGRMQKALKAVLDDIEDLRRSIFDEHAEGSSSIPPEKQQAFQREWNDALKGEIEFNEHRINVADLKIDTNQLDPSVIASLIPVLDGEVE